MRRITLLYLGRKGAGNTYSIEMTNALEATYAPTNPVWSLAFLLSVASRQPILIPLLGRLVTQIGRQRFIHAHILRGTSAYTSGKISISPVFI